MSTEERNEILLKDICARIPYGVKVRVGDNSTPREVVGIHSSWVIVSTEAGDDHAHISNVRPYLRPMEEMTEEEEKELDYFDLEGADSVWIGGSGNLVDWLNQHKLDWRELIKERIAIKAEKGVYE